MNRPTKYAIVTGSSSGLGRSFAHQLAGMGYGLLLVALDDVHLENTRREIEKNYEIDVRAFGTDLSDHCAAEKVSQWVEEQDVPISILINNVGVGYVSGFLEMPLDYYEKVVNLNAIVMMKLSYLVLPRLMKEENAYILNIGSIASLFPAPYKAIYSASKHFVKSFSYALREELKNDVKVSVAFPAGIYTNESIKDRAHKFGWLARLGMLEPEKVARQCLRGMFRGQRRIMPGNAPVVYSRIRDVLGYRLTMSILMRNFKKGIINH